MTTRRHVRRSVADKLNRKNTKGALNRSVEAVASAKLAQYDPCAVLAILEDPMLEAMADMLSILKEIDRNEDPWTDAFWKRIRAVIAKAEPRWEGRTTLARARSVAHERRKPCATR